ncbi:MAG: chemotaxis protein CheA [Candidatus Korobacteraceae bacterium]|jgi:two-component system chemotaxis sensor kinase CheA
MNSFSEERVNELRAIFFESAQELLQAMNEEGLRLEQAPADGEIVREIRRTVHTLKGDAAACGYGQLSELAHALEDALTTETAARAGAALAGMVLQAADTFEAYLAAYRNGAEPPSGNDLRQTVQQLISPAPSTPVAKAKAKSAPAGNPAKVSAPIFQWNEYERLVIAKSAGPEAVVLNVGLTIDSNCVMPAAALQVIWRALDESGAVLVTHPERERSEPVAVIEAAVATTRTAEWVKKRCRIPGVVSAVHVSPYHKDKTQAPLISEQPDSGEPQEPDSASPAPPADAVPAPNTAQPTGGEHSGRTLPVTENLLRVDAERIDAVLDLLGELIIAKSALQQVLAGFGHQNRKDPIRMRLADALARQSQVIQNLQRAVMKIRMVPVEQLFRRFPRIVRDVAKRRHKEVQLVVEGESTDLDKRILDALAEPLTHLLRNAVDHGVETPEVRRRAGKPACGIVSVKAYHQGNQIMIEVADDGAGMDHEAILAKAVEKNIITEEEADKTAPQDAFRLVLEAGFSTAEKVTEISGRGVGLDVVKATIENMKGAVSINTARGVGTTFKLRLPLTLAIIKAMLFSASTPASAKTALAGGPGAGNQLYAVPLGSVLEITRAFGSEIHTLEGHEVLRLREEVIPLIRMEAAPAGPSGKLFVIVVLVADRKFGLVVEKLKGEEELVIKALDDALVATDLVSGASVLGDGRVVLVLNLPEMVSRSGDKHSYGRKAAAQA